MKKLLFFSTFLLLLLSSLFAQEALKSIEEDYYDYLSIQGVFERPTLGYRTLSDNTWNLTSYSDSSSNIWNGNKLSTTFMLFESESNTDNFFLSGINQDIKLRLYGPVFYNSYNPTVPFGQNDGALWQGAGYNASLTTGVRLEGFGFELTFKPQIVFSQNNPWDYLQGPSDKFSPYGYFAIPGAPSRAVKQIDIVQRYGEDPLFNFNWGDSEIRYTWKTLTIGFGTQSPWLGSSWLNPQLGSNHADPYLKLDVGFRKTPVINPFNQKYLGEIEGRMWLGKLEQSDYIDVKNKINGVYVDFNQDRMITMGSLSFSPSFINGFTIGMNRLFLTYWRPDNLSYFFRLFNFKHDNATGSGNDEDQKVALYADWLFPNEGFEVYGELGIDDFSAHEIPNPFHTAIYTLGIKQIINHDNGLKGLFNLEWNANEMSQDYQMQYPYGGYYFHSFIKQGFTNNGQIIGAGTAPMGSSQYIGYTLYYPKGKTTFRLHRYCNDNNVVLNLAVGADADAEIVDHYYALYETYVTGGIDTTYFITPSLSISGGGTAIIRVFPKYTKGAKPWETTCSFNMSLRYTF